MSPPLSFITSVLLLLCCKQFEAIQVTTEQGTLEGFVSTSRNGSEFYSFYGIPFAKPPVGELRFQPPKEPDHWEGVREAKTPPPVCIQSQPFLLPFNPAGNLIMGQEDCLYLNVFTPTVTPPSLMPVMFYIHGGGFYWGGSAQNGPEYFMDHPNMLFTDGAFVASSLELAQRVNSTTFFYLYDHQNEHSFGEFQGNVTDEYGVSHGDDLISLFYLKGVFPPIKKSPTTDYAVSLRMVKFWVNFMTNGDPNGERKIWYPFRSDNFAYLHIKTESDDMEEKFRFKNYVFWKHSVFPAWNSDD